MFSSSDSKGNFLEQTKAAREERAVEKKRDNAAVKIQSLLKGFVARKKFRTRVVTEFDNLISNFTEGSKSGKNIPAVQIYHSTTRLLLVWDKAKDKERIENLCSVLVDRLEEEKVQLSYIGVALNREHSIYWIVHIKKLLWICCLYLNSVSPELAADSRCMLLYLRTLVSFTSTSNWALLKVPAMEKLKSGMNKLCANIMGDLVTRGFLTTMKRVLLKGLCGSKPSLKHVSLFALFTLSLRPLILAEFSEKLLSMYLINIFSVPALIHHLNAIAPECVNQLVTHEVFPKSMGLLSSEQDLRIVFNTLEGNYALCLLANLIHMAHIEKDSSLKGIYFPTFIFVTCRMLSSCQKYVGNKKSEVTHWHPVLGWFAQGLDSQLHASMPLVRRQLSFLWAAPLTSILLDELRQVVAEVAVPDPVLSAPAASSGSNLNNFMKKVLERPGKGNGIKYIRLGSEQSTRVALMASLYHTALTTLTQLKLDILTGLCYQNEILHLLWQFLWTLGPLCGLKAFLSMLDADSSGTCPEFQLLTLFCDCMNHYITILDDIEMYEQQTPFRIGDYVLMSNFLNQFAYKAVLGGQLDAKTLNSNNLFNSVHTLLLRFYQRDCRRQYTPDGHWLLKDMRISSFMSDFDKNKKANQVILQKMPHIIPQDERVQLFRRHVATEKVALGIADSSCHHASSSTLITIHRSRIVEDGYRQLAVLDPKSLKGIVRVRFVNEQGLFEAGIDQDGVFKEFLEETIKRVFDPSLNLFRTTADERLYPSPTSAMQDNHLQLFEFVGRMLGKAVYEGIVVDVPFASFFLSQLLGGAHHQAFYSSIDELPSLDDDLYRSLTYVKHHKGDVADLDLNFSIDQDLLGKLETSELVPGGKATPVTNENKINYIHLMAHFRMHTQIKDQTAAFIKGFRSIINIDWLSLFSTPELQRLVSGDNSPVDFKDLRRNTQYYGGFHDSHKVIGWLWDVLENDFSEQEKRFFLKFVTSCSKPPLLGFAHLEPPFSIRCVEVGDDEDTGDTIGSVIRGFFTIRKKDPQLRLPTSSTCFNLLKLPNYQRKSTLREKLRYAICSNTGFELS